jgi:hypothetical protein
MQTGGCQGEAMHVCTSRSIALFILTTLQRKSWRDVAPLSDCVGYGAPLTSRETVVNCSLEGSEKVKRKTVGSWCAQLLDHSNIFRKFEKKATVCFKNWWD